MGKEKYDLEVNGSLIETDKKFNPIEEIKLPFSQVHDLLV